MTPSFTVRPGRPRPRLILGLLVPVSLLGSAGCATTRIVSQWANPEYAAPRFNRILVIGISTQPSLRRTFEDEFVAKLMATGVDAGFLSAVPGGLARYYEPPRIYQERVYVSETSLYDVARNQLVWTATAHTKPSGNLRKDISGYVKAVIETLKHDHLLARAS
jgi:hypothetical protein